MAQCFTLSVFYHFPKCDPHVTNSRHCGAHHWHRNGPYSGWQVFIKLSWKHTRVRLRLRLHWKGPSVFNYSKTHHPTFSKSPPLWIDLGRSLCVSLTQIAPYCSLSHHTLPLRHLLSYLCMYLVQIQTCASVLISPIELYKI